VRDHELEIGLDHSSDYDRFIQRDFAFYSGQYLRLMEASKAEVPGLEHVLYNTDHGYTLQHVLLLSPLQPGDSAEIVDLKLRLVAMYVDILLTWRIWNFRSIAYSTMQYATFLAMKEIRALDPEPLARKLVEMLDREEETFATMDRFRVHQQNRWYVRRILARITVYVENQSGMPSRYMEYVTTRTKNRYEVEHIWANKPDRHSDEFEHSPDFQAYRDRIGGLVLLPRDFNASYGALPYKSKLPEYRGRNLLARSLHPDCYKHNPGFLRFVQESGLPFQPHEEFKKADLDARQELVRQIAERIWDPENLLREVGL
jgi:hypothetical protein